MMPRAAVLSMICIFSAAALFAEEKRKLDTIIVTSSRLATEPGENARVMTSLDDDSFDMSVYKAIPDLIGEVGGIDVRRRGPQGVQADVDIRGTTFEQNTILIDGVNVNDPQTGHFNMDLPLTLMDVDRI